MKLKNYYKTLIKAFTQPLFYLEVMQKPFKFAFSFFIFSGILLGLSLTLHVHNFFLPDVQNASKQIIEEGVTNYPQNLEIRWEDERLSMNQSEPFLVSYPAQMATTDHPTKILGAFLPEEIDSIESINQNLEAKEISTPLILFTPKKLFINDLQTWTELSLDEIFVNVDTFLINKAQIDALKPQMITNIERLVQAFKKISWILIPLGFILIRLWQSLVESVLIWIILKLNHFKIRFLQSWQLSLALTVIAEIINQLTRWLYPDFHFPMTSLAFWVLFTYIFWTKRQKIAKISSSSQE